MTDGKDIADGGVDIMKTRAIEPGDPGVPFPADIWDEPNGELLAMLQGCASAPMASMAGLADIGGVQQGWGKALDDALHGIRAGQLLALGAYSAKAGKSYFLHMLLDGLAMDPRTPVWLVTENPRLEVYRRRYLKATMGPHQRQLLGTAFDGQPFDVHAGVDRMPRARSEIESVTRGMRVADISTLSGKEGGALSGAALVDQLREMIDDWRAPDGGAGVPVVCLDPFQRFIADAGDEYNSTRALVADLRRLADEGQCCVILVSDTNKASAKIGAAGDMEDASSKAAGAFKGAYELAHQVDAMLLLEPLAAYTDGKEHGVMATVAVNRHGPTGKRARQAFEVTWPAGQMTEHLDWSKGDAAGVTPKDEGFNL